jgi:hypothetical protein
MSTEREWMTSKATPERHGGEVVLHDRDVGPLAQLLELTGVAVDGGHRSLSGPPSSAIHCATEPAPGPELQAVPPRSHPERPKAPDGGLVVQRLELAQARRFVGVLFHIGYRLD